jgi:hypothetical protein
MLSWTSAPFVRCGTKQNYILTLATLVAREMRLWRRLWWDMAETATGGILESGGRFCVGLFCRNLALVAVMFSNLIHFWRKLIDFCTSNTICKDNTAINFITFNTKRSIPVNFNESWARFVCKLHYFLTQRDPFPSTLTGHELGLYVSCITF